VALGASKGTSRAIVVQREAKEEREKIVFVVRKKPEKTRKKERKKMTDEKNDLPDWLQDDVVDVPEFTYESPPPPSRGQKPPYASQEEQEDEPSVIHRLWGIRLKLATWTLAFQSALAALWSVFLPVALVLSVIVLFHNAIYTWPVKRNFKNIASWIWENTPEVLTTMMIVVIMMWNGDGAIALLVTAILLWHDSRSD
jgi:hypothetical protein